MCLLDSLCPSHKYLAQGHNTESLELAAFPLFQLSNFAQCIKLMPFLTLKPYEPSHEILVVIIEGIQQRVIGACKFVRPFTACAATITTQNQCGIQTRELLVNYQLLLLCITSLYMNANFPESNSNSF